MPKFEVAGATLTPAPLPAQLLQLLCSPGVIWASGQGLRSASSSFGGTKGDSQGTHENGERSALSQPVLSQASRYTNRLNSP